MIVWFAVPVRAHHSSVSHQKSDLIAIKLNPVLKWGFGCLLVHLMDDWADTMHRRQVLRQGVSYLLNLSAIVS